MEKKQAKKTDKKPVEKVAKKEVKKEDVRKNIIEIGKKIIIPVYKLQESDTSVLVRVNYDKNYENYCTHVWFDKNEFLHYKDRYFVEGEVVKIFDNDVELEFHDKNVTFTLLFRNNMVEKEI